MTPGMTEILNLSSWYHVSSCWQKVWEEKNVSDIIKFAVPARWSSRWPYQMWSCVFESYSPRRDPSWNCKCGHLQHRCIVKPGARTESQRGACRE